MKRTRRSSVWADDGWNWTRFTAGWQEWVANHEGPAPIPDDAVVHANGMEIPLGRLARQLETRFDDLSDAQLGALDGYPVAAFLDALDTSDRGHTTNGPSPPDHEQRATRDQFLEDLDTIANLQVPAIERERARERAWRGILSGAVTAEHLVAARASALAADGDPLVAWKAAASEALQVLHEDGYTTPATAVSVDLGNRVFAYGCFAYELERLVDMGVIDIAEARPYGVSTEIADARSASPKDLDRNLRGIMRYLESIGAAGQAPLARDLDAARDHGFTEWSANAMIAACGDNGLAGVLHAMRERGATTFITTLRGKQWPIVLDEIERLHNLGNDVNALSPEHIVNLPDGNQVQLASFIEYAKTRYVGQTASQQRVDALRARGVTFDEPPRDRGRRTASVHVERGRTSDLGR